MPRSRILIVLCLSVGVVCSSALKAFAQGTTVFHINVPRKVPPGATPPAGGPMQIMIVKATVSVASDAPVTFTITDPEGQTWNTGALTPGMAPDPNCASGVVVCHAFPPPAASTCLTPALNCFDTVNITPSAGLVGDPNRNRYTIYFSLFSNYDLSQSCKGAQANPTDTFTITVTSGPNITGVCLESFDGLNRSTNSLSCTSTTFFVPLTEAVATVQEFPAPTLGCFKERPGVDVILVLDRSGSMASSTLGGAPQPKIQALRGAVGDFVLVWDGLRSTETSPPQDKIGVVLFDTAASWWTVGNLVPGLNVFSTVSADISNNNNLNTIAAGGSTSIGGGLTLAAPQLAPAVGRRKVALLMSDGIQNTDPMVGIDPNNSKQVVTYCLNLLSPLCTSPSGCTHANTLADPCPLPNQPPMQIYTVTVGTGLAVSSGINQNIANASGGFYINTEDNADLLKPFFLELLQNFLKFNTYETVRMISKNVAPTAPFSASVPLSTTSRDVGFNLMWPSNLGLLRLTITPPGGAKPIVREGKSGFIAVNQRLPLPAPFDPTGSWGILVEAPQFDIPAAVVATGGGGIPFELHVIADDPAINTDLSVVAADYAPGDNIRLRAKLTQFGLPILGLRSNPGDKIIAELIGPGQSIGDILSDSTASAVSSGSDPQSPAEAKLFNTLQNAPSALVRNPGTVELFDDGKPEHGDDVAGDGIYSALYRATLPGHYNFLFAVEGTAKNVGHFSRQQLRTAYVRSVPNAGNTVFQSSIQSGNTLSIVMTPRVKPGPGCPSGDPKCGRMGPGWANYFWFTAPGQTPFKAKDNLNGTYTATLPFTGSRPPKVSVHFENVLMVIGDSVTSNQLPVPLGPDNVLVDDVNKQAGRVAVFLDAGIGIPHGTFGNAFNTGFSLNAGLEYIATNHFSAEGIFGYHHFPAKFGSALNLYQFSVNAKTYLTTSGSVRPFINGGIGGYKFSPGPTNFGGNFGGGVLYNITAHWGLQGSYNFHAVNTPVAATKFSTLQGGIRFVF